MTVSLSSGNSKFEIKPVGIVTKIKSVLSPLCEKEIKIIYCGGKSFFHKTLKPKPV
jgi:hypothetical protein